MQLVNIGFGNIIAANKIVAIVRKTRAVLIMDSGHIILAAVQPETVAGRVDKDITQPVQIDE